MEDIPYSTLKQKERAYEIMLLCDQYGNAFTDLAKEFSISVARVKQSYDWLKIQQIRLYINHIAIALKQENASKIEKIFYDAYECYQDYTYACAYLEKRFPTILTEYRNGEPGMPPYFLESMPPFQPALSEETVARIIEMREAEKASFLAIGKELQLTKRKAQHTYQHFYHRKVLALIKNLQEKAENEEEKHAIWDNCFRNHKSSKKQYDMLRNDMQRKET